MKLLLFVASIWTIFGFGLINCTISPYFTSPISSVQYIFNQNVTVKVDFTFTGVSSANVVQTCGQDTKSEPISATDPTLQFSPPTDYVGKCVYELTDFSTPPLVYDQVDVDIVGIVNIQSVYPPSPIQAGTSTTVSWNIVPAETSPSQLFTVTLECAGTDYPSTTSTMDYSFSYQVPSFVYGNCKFKVSSAIYITQTPFDVIITQQVNLLNPQSEQTYAITTGNINVEYATDPNPSINGLSVTSTFDCPDSGTSASPVSFSVNVPSGIPYSYPSNSYGRCSLKIDSASANYLTFATAPVYFFLKYQASLSAPNNIYLGQSFKLKILANSPTTGTISTATIDLVLNCGSTSVQSFGPIVVNQDTTVKLDASVPTGSCSIEPIGTSNFFYTDFSASVAIAPLPITFVKPQIFTYNQSETMLVEVVPNVILDPPVTGPIELLLSCSPNSMDFTVNFNEEKSIKFDSDIYGTCILSPSSSMYLALTNPIITVKLDLIFSGIPANLYFGQPFSLTVTTTSGTPPPNTYTQVQLFCNGGNTSVYSWSNQIQLGLLTQLDAPNTVLSSSNCQLKTVPNENYIQATSSTLSIGPGVITIDSPTSGNSYSAGSTINVQWTTNPTPSNNESYTVSLQCGLDNYPSESTNLNLMNYLVPEDAFGACSLSVLSINYVTQTPVNLTVTQQVTLSTPQSDESFLLTSPIIDVNYVTSSNPDILGQTVTANFSCIDSATSENQIIFTLNPSMAIPYNYPAGSYGKCSFKIVSASSTFLTYSPDPVFFYLKYETSLEVASTLYMLQIFNITIQVSPTPVFPVSDAKITLGIYCGSNMTTPVQTFAPISINVVQTLELDQNVSAGSCTIKPTTTSDIFSDFSEAVQVAPVPIYYDESTITSYIQPANFSINIGSNVTNAAGSFDLLLTCTAGITTITYTLGQVYDNDIPYDAYGDCEIALNNPAFTFSTSAENPLAVSITYQLNIENYPKTIYTGQPFEFVVSTEGNPPLNLTTQVQLYCNSNLVPNLWPDSISLNKDTNLTVPAAFTPSSNCELKTVTSPNFIGATSDKFSIENVELQFDKPSVTEYKNGEEILVNVIAVSFPTLQGPLTVAFECGAFVDDPFDVDMNAAVPKSYLPPASAFGPCIFSISNPPIGFKSPAPVQVTISWQLLIEAPSTIYVGIPFDIEVDPSDVPTNLATETIVKLTCDNLVVDSWSAVPFGTKETLTTLITIQPSQNCVFSTNTSTNYILEATSGPVVLEKLSLAFDSPKDSEIVIIPDKVPIYVSTKPDISPMPEDDLTAVMACGTYDTQTTGLHANTQNYLDYDSDFFYGPCNLTLTDYPLNMNPASQVNFFLKFGLKFVDPPVAIQIGKFFNVFIESSVVPPSILGSTTVSLICDDVIIQNWGLINLNADNLLQVSPTGPKFLFNCFLSTPLNDVYMTTASTPVVYLSIDSPFGGVLSAISPEQVTQIIRNLTIYASDQFVPLTINN